MTHELVQLAKRIRYLLVVLSLLVLCFRVIIKALSCLGKKKTEQLRIVMFRSGRPPLKGTSEPEVSVQKVEKVEIIPAPIPGILTVGRFSFFIDE